MTQSNTSNFFSRFTHTAAAPTVAPASRIRRLVGVALVGTLGLLGPGAASAQNAITISLEDSRGNALTDELTVGRSLYVTVDGGVPGTDYRLSLINGNNVVADEATATAPAAGTEFTERLFFKSNIWTVGCQPGGPALPGGPGDVFGPFPNLEDASAALDGMTLWLELEEWVGSLTGGGSWQLVSTQSITMKDPEEAIYYWSDQYGYEKCMFLKDEDIYLSVYKGNLEDFSDSRVFMLKPPGEHKDWIVDFDFPEVRGVIGCTITSTDGCTYDNGSDEDLPNTVTIPMVGKLPESGNFIALIRGSDLQGSVRYACDRATEGQVWIEDQPDLGESAEGWGCPPCPD
ncbi:MAG: hypothetical protein AAGM22_09625 [Acidobacteriota bacterium]